MNFLKRLFGLGEPPKRVELPPICDPVFGDLKWDSNYDWWEGRYVSPSGEEFEVTVEPPSDAEPQPTEGQRQAFQALVPRLAELKMLAVRDYFPNFSVDAGEEPYTEARMSEELVPGNIHVEAGLGVRMSWLDSLTEILGGHALTATVTADGKTYFGLEG
ncbi:hypothetical protein [Brevifollis gellanilyticus]|uniref:DUF2262 domain-containing protein n=1 Tax=Brevifollis gellanilyticus TaxID=748831 RepID=A0A512MGS0_9BACT|nr:hypothetical protein [Brevifollis gellanilyticus]GEP45919.1 hypothetical protein BGE01nite_52100 [Brevifollis gellanilyticus]